MAVYCANCGEELLGAVNRCWRCGTKVVSRPDAPDLPPVRQPPMAAAFPVAPLPVADSGEAVPSAALPSDGGPADSDQVHDAQLSNPNESRQSARSSERRVGSPFAGPSIPPTVERPNSSADRSPPGLRLRPGPAAARAAALVALLLGVLSFAASFVSVGALFIALAGLPAGIWGLYSDRRGQAIVGMLLCCVALALSGFQAAALLYQFQYGMSPWETSTSY